MHALWDDVSQGSWFLCAMTWRAIVLRCWSSGECEGHGRRTHDVQSGIVQPRNAQVVAAMSSSSSSWVQKVQLLCARSNAGLDDKSGTLAPTSHGEEAGQSGGDCCCVSLCTRNSALPFDTSFCNTPPLLPRVHLLCLPIAWFVYRKLSTWYLGT